MTPALFAIIVLLFGCTCRADDDDPDFLKYRDFGHMTGLIGNYLSRPPGQLAMELVGEYRLTFYWITRQRKSDGPTTERILVRSPDTGHEHPLEVSRAFKRKLDLEGTAILADGRLINVMGRHDRLRYLDISKVYPTGLGSRNNPLTPFISVAVHAGTPDMPFGTRLYIPDVVGLPLPDGGHHDGIFTVDDTGSGLAMDQIDIFVFMKDNWPEFQRYLQAHTQRFFVYAVFQHSAPAPRENLELQTAAPPRSPAPTPTSSLPRPNR